ncbi:MAG: SDR family NAD(P)-dependent oxidoreductase [Gammaproteobacteria bacterium]|nr:SDR family NAD(P)-dependent oxidoreductase [Gammaproteobacteria bacterium]
MNLKRRNIVITGGTAGIGLELVRQMQQENDLLVIASNEERLEHLTRAFPRIMTCRADLAQLSEVEAAAAAARRYFDRIDVLINNAAIQYTPTFVEESFDYASIEREVTVNFTTVCALTSLLLPALIHDGEAAIVNVNSGLGLMPKKNSAVYCATKAAVNVFSQSLRHQLEDTNVRVLQAFMPLVDTAMTTGRGNDRLSPAQAANAMLRGIALGIEDNDIGEIRLLRSLVRFAPGIARKIMKAA